jgi:murein DD-endopeptidase MepM/ murein hydrolase activator NlpD
MGQHRAERGHRARRSTDPAPVRRRRGARARRRLAGRLPALPAFVGLAALAVAGAGTVGFTHQGETPSTRLQLSAGANALTGTDAVGFNSDRAVRAQAISRDSERQALQDAADQELQQAAEAQNRQRNAALASLASAAEKRANQIARNQWVLPTEDFHLTAGFGQVSGLWSSFHTGLDFAAPTGTPIFAVAGGVITDTGWDGAYGNRTVERLPDGTEIWYAHQSAIEVHQGQRVVQGQTIGRVGATGNTTGPHLHLEVRPGGGDPVDPYYALLHHGVRP